jgi:hypothetical protein
MPRIYAINLGGGGTPVDPFTLIGRAGQEPIPNGADSVSVVFSTLMANTNYAVIASIVNVTDANPISLIPVISDKQTTGFTATFNAPTDSGNYVLDYIVAGDL